jgi:outer membrane immunogenic protein
MKKISVVATTFAICGGLFLTHSGSAVAQTADVSAKTDQKLAKEIAELRRQDAELRDRIRRLEAKRGLAAMSSNPKGSAQQVSNAGYGEAYAEMSVAPTWTGFYVGANIGGGWGNANVDYSANDPYSMALAAQTGFGWTLPSASFGYSGALGGLQLGYNWQFNRNWLVGVETDINWSGMKGSSSSSIPIGAGIFGLGTTNADEQIKWFGTVRARLGYLPTDNLLTYITGGFAYGQVKQSGSVFNNSNKALGYGLQPFPAPFVECAAFSNCWAGSKTSTATGWTAGVGLEYAFWQKFSIKVEYLYVSFYNTSFDETAAITPPASSITGRFNHTNFNVGRLGLNYRF